MSTYLGFIRPAYNAFFLMMLCIPAVLMMVHNLKKEESVRVTNLGRRSIGSPVQSRPCFRHILVPKKYFTRFQIDTGVF